MRMAKSNTSRTIQLVYKVYKLHFYDLFAMKIATFVVNRLRNGAILISLPENERWLF
jgi:hypothetical protein